MLKKLAYGLVVTLLAGGLLAGCTANINVKPTEGGGINIVADTGAKGVSNNSNNKNSSSKSSSKKSTKTYTLKFGDHTSKMYTVTNSANLYMQNKNNRPKRLSFAGKTLYAMTNDNILRKYIFEADKWNLKRGSSQSMKSLWEGSHVSANTNGVYFVKSERPYFLPKEFKTANVSNPTFCHMEALNNSTAYLYKDGAQVRKVSIDSKGKVIKSLGIVRKNYDLRKNTGDCINKDVFMLSDKDGTYYFGQGVREGHSIGRGVYYDNNLKQKAFFGAKYNSKSSTQAKSYISKAGDAVVTDKYVVFCDKGRALVKMWVKKTGVFVGSLKYSNLGTTGTTSISMAHMSGNRIMLVANNPNSSNKKDIVRVIDL